ncbi:MAG: PspC domain-containing protein, partial [Simkaniaceae bacterium]|nr:PspC domain-containing protein [Simkaniaceae bacterium]
MTIKKLYRCRWDRKIAGVFGGLGQYINIDPTILRLIAVFLIIPTGVITLPLLYLIAALLIPESPSRAYIQPKFKKLMRNPRKRVFAGI